MEYTKYATIIVGKSMMSLSLKSSLLNTTVEDINNTNIKDLTNTLALILQTDVNDMFQKKNINEKPIVLDFISEVQPIQCTVLVDCEFCVVFLKRIQDYLMKNNYKIKFIL